MIKTKREIALIRKAAAISNSCIPIIEKSLRETGMTERELSRRVRRNIYSQGGRLSFTTLVACGARSAMIHPKPIATDGVIEGIGYIDFGASWKGYKVDLTVPFVKGKVGARERKIVKTVLDAYRLSLKNWRPEIHCWELHRKADGFISSKGFKMGHALGHGIGKNLKESYHEGPLIYAPKEKILRKMERLAAKGNKKARRKLIWWHRVRNVRMQPGMCVTIEPGAYVDKVGGSRIENTFLVEGRKLKALTKARLIEVR